MSDSARWALKRKEASPSSGLSLECPHAGQSLAEVSGVEMCRSLTGPSISLVINWLIWGHAHQGGHSVLRDLPVVNQLHLSALLVSWQLSLHLHPLVGNAEREFVVSVGDKGENQLGVPHVSEILS